MNTKAPRDQELSASSIRENQCASLADSEHTRLEPASEVPPINRDQPEPKNSRGLGGALLLFCAIALIGLVLGIIIGESPIADRERPFSSNVFYYLFGSQEPLSCALHLAIAAGLVCLYQRGTQWSFAAIPAWIRRHGMLLSAVTVFGVTLLGTWAIYHRFPLSMDEYCAEFQGTVFSEGKIFGQVPGGLQSIGRSLTPIFVIYDSHAHTWLAPYLPVYAGLRAAFSLVGDSWIVNPLLAGISVLAIAGIARRLWPETPAAGWLAAGLLATSPQFLLTAMSAYAMPAHLAFNLVWLWLYTRQDRTGLALAPLLGILAVGLHQPNVHLLFAFPFCARLLWQKRWEWTAYYGAMYAGALGIWWAWWQWVRPDALATSGAILGIPGSRQAFIQLLNMVMIFSWQSAAAAVLAFLALRRWKTLPAVVQDAAFGGALTFGFYFFFTSDQGHGWGYRYFHPVLGNLMLLAAAGWQPLVKALGEARARTLVVASLAAAAFILFPLRAFQAEEFIRPFANADAALKTVKADIIIVPPMAVWYGLDLVRNDPFVRDRPVRARISGPSLGTRPATGEVSVFIATPEYLAPFGLIPLKTHE